MAQFQSEIELRVKVLDKELDQLEKRIEKFANPFSASGAKSKTGLAKQRRERLNIESDIASAQLTAIEKLEKRKTNSFSC